MNPAPDRPARRRGVLMLVVVSMLTLFLMLGTTYLVVATRAKQAARAQARLAMESSSVGISPARLLDAVLLKIVRGGPGGITAPLLIGTSGTANFESLLSDRYGESVTGTASGLAPIAGVPLITGTLTTGTTAGLESASDLAGRVLTLLGTGREPTSHRILRATPTSGTNLSAIVVLDYPPRRRDIKLNNILPAVVNGFDFDGSSSNEAYDGFDDKNPFLAQIEPADANNPNVGPNAAAVSQSVVFRASYVPTLTGTAARSLLGSFSDGIARGADNDNDGSPDGFFLDFGLPSVSAVSGSIQFDASVLVVDLDSRFNVNAHGSLVPSLYPNGCIGWPQAGGDVPTVSNTPLGSGYGPAEVNATWMFPQGSYPAEMSRRMRGLSENPDLDVDALDASNPLPPSAVQPGPFLLSGAGNSAQESKFRPKSSRFSPGTPLPRIGDVEGRYGEATRVNNAATALSKNQTDSNTWRRLDSDTSSFSTARPGVPATNDTLSLIRDFGVTPAVDNSISGFGLGIPNLWWSGASGFNWAPGGGGAPRSVFNSPPDLHGRLLTTTATSASIVPRLMFASPEWGNEATDDPYEVRLDPRAARNGPSGTTGDNWDNIYGYAELESLLRQYDRDGQQLPKRLLAVLGPASEEARLRVTTDSWDTTMITGTAAKKLRDFVRSGTGIITGTSAVTGLINNELARGERLNLARPLNAAKPTVYNAAHPYYVQRQALFKDLYTAVIAITGTANIAEKAQWAANAVEFQDADSTMTPFEYDSRCGDTPHAWKVDGDLSQETGETGRRSVVWGAERPELLIQEVFAWRNAATGTSGFAVTIHRPWNATAYASGSASIAGEPCEGALDTLSSGSTGRPTNVVDLGKNSSATAASIPNPSYLQVSGTTYPIWRLRIVASGTTYIRLDTNTSADSNEFVVDTGTADMTVENKPALPVDASVTVYTGTSIILGDPAALPTATTGTARLALTGSIAKIKGPTITGTGTIFLERLSDPTVAVTTGTANIPGYSYPGSVVWTDTTAPDSAVRPLRYVVVDQCPFNPVQTQSIAPPAQATSNIRRTTGDTAFWANPSSAPKDLGASLSKNAVVGFPSTLSPGATAWFHWPNRPLTSAAELFLVPKGSASSMLANYHKPVATDNDLLALTGANTRFLLDAVHVPTRFSAIHTTINASGTATLAENGIFGDVAPVNQLSSYREPGRVNLNTVTSNDVWNAVVAGPLQVSGSAKPLVVSGTAGANFGSSPAKSMLDILALASSGTAPRGDTYAGNPAMAAAKNRNPLHEFYTATRLANTATIRSNVFAIWITVRETIEGNPDSVKLHRGFYIVDRSIPVAHDPGKDHNVWDCVVLRRIIE